MDMAADVLICTPFFFTRSDCLGMDPYSLRDLIMNLRFALATLQWWVLFCGLRHCAYRSKQCERSGLFLHLIALMFVTFVPACSLLTHGFNG